MDALEFFDSIMRLFLLFAFAALLAISVWSGPTGLSVAAAATFEPALSSPDAGEDASAWLRTALIIAPWAVLLALAAAFVLTRRRERISPIWHE